MQEQLESRVAEASAESRQLASKVQKLEAQCSGLEASMKDAEQQQKHDLCYQDELVTDKQQATQVRGFVCSVGLQHSLMACGCNILLVVFTEVDL